MEIKVGFPELEDLRKKMGAEVVAFTIDHKPIKSVDDIKIKLNEGLEINISQLEIVGGVYSFKGEQLLIFIYETRKEKEYVIDEPENNVRFHLKDCKTIERMQRENLFEARYIGTNNTNGIFSVVVYSDENRINTEEIETNLKVCKNCLKELNYKAYKNNKRDVWNAFNIAEFFDEYKTYFKEKPKYTCENVPPNDYPDDWEDISRNTRKQKGWECHDCGVNLNRHQNLLHVHHRNRAKFDSRASNLEVVCILCHSKKPGHGTMHVSTDNRELIMKVREMK